MTKFRHDYVNMLECRLKSAKHQLQEFKTGEKYISMQEAYEALLAEKDRELRKVKAELATANSMIVTNCKNWLQIIEDLEKEHRKALKKMEDRALTAERQKYENKDKFLEKTRELYAVLEELEEERGKNLKLTAQINRDHENSSKPSSQIQNRKKITNNREVSGKSPGGQIGHKHHPRKMHEPTSVTEIPAPEEYANNSGYVLTGNIITKQLVDIRIERIVNQYHTAEYRNVHTGTRVHAEFPGGLVNDVTYGGNIKSLVFLLNNFCNVSIGKISDFVCELTDGHIKMSTGMICGLSKEFSRKTEAEQKKAFADMQLEPVVNVDLTTAKVNGENLNVVVCATPHNVLYFPREHKGHEAIKGTPVEDYLGTLIHDHDRTFYKYGRFHQECLDHVLRYLKDSILNEPNLTWNSQMRELIRKMIHFRKSLDPADKRNPDEIVPETVAELEREYDEVLELAKTEYEFEPPSKYYKEGINLYKRMHKYKKEHLLFLHDRCVSHSNSLSERLLRIYKRKQHQVMSFRSFGGLEGLCNALGTIATIRAQGKSLYASVAEIFEKPSQNPNSTVA